MSVPLIDREPTLDELEQLRLILSTFQDGTGMMAIPGGTLPGWRDFERATALAFGGTAQESKAVFDVILPCSAISDHFYGISCKMRRMLKEARKQGRVNIEVSNSSGKFWDALRLQGLSAENYKDTPAVVGKTILDLVDSWHQIVSVAQGGTINIDRSIYLVLLWDDQGNYQLYRYGLKFPDAETIGWTFNGRRLIGKDEEGVLFEWYGESGGQLKYYPRVATATWISHVMRLEPLPEGENEYSLVNKAKMYFPAQWKRCSKDGRPEEEI